MKGGPRYYRIDKKTGRARWSPTRRMHEIGFRTEHFEGDTAEARARAEQINAAWDIYRRGGKVSDEFILAVGYTPGQADKVRADAVVVQIHDITAPFVNSSAAAHIVKGMRSLAWHLERASREATRKQIDRDVLLVAS